MPKRIFAIVCSLVLMVGFGIVITLIQSQPVDAKQEGNWPKEPQPIQSPPRTSSTFAGPVAVGSPVVGHSGFNQVGTGLQSFAVDNLNTNRVDSFILVENETTQLTRCSYLLPSEVAETLTRLFDHETTVLVECRTDEIDEDDNAGLVKFVVTADPQTQIAIQKFVKTVFSEKKIRSLISKRETATEDLAPKPSESSEMKVSLKLPSMTCGGCATAVTEYLEGEEGISQVQLDVSERTAEFCISKIGDVHALISRAEGENQFFKNASLISIKLSKPE